MRERDSRSLAIPVGGMELACAQGIHGKNWKASHGSFRITAEIEITDSNDLNLQNNSCEGHLTIPNGKVIPGEILKIIE